MIATRERLAYAAGDTGFNFVWQSIELYLLYFYVQTLGLPIGAASGIFLAGAVIDWLSDPLIGAAADRASPRLPLRAWLLFGGPALGVALALAFARPGLTGGALIGWACATHLLLRVTYSVGNIPYAALTARISADPRDHVALTALRMQGAALGGLIATGLYAALPATGAGDYWTGAAILGAAAQPLFLLTWGGVTERVRPPRGDAVTLRAEMAGLFRMLTGSKAVFRLVLVIVAAGLAITTVHKSILFLFRELHAEELGRLAAMLPALALLLTVPAWTAAARRFGRVRTLKVTAAVNAAVLCVAALAGGGRLAVDVACVAAAVAAGCGMSVMFWALVPATIAEVEDVEGESCAARVFALGTTARKLGQALAPQVIAASLWSAGSVLPGLAIAGALALGVILFAGPRERA